MVYSLYFKEIDGERGGLVGVTCKVGEGLEPEWKTGDDGMGGIDGMRRRRGVRLVCRGINWG